MDAAKNTPYGGVKYNIGEKYNEEKYYAKEAGEENSNRTSNNDSGKCREDNRHDKAAAEYSTRRKTIYTKGRYNGDSDKQCLLEDVGGAIIGVVNKENPVVGYCNQ